MDWYFGAVLIIATQSSNYEREENYKNYGGD
jgi:hypothetical protein